ncbi:MAG: DUF4174 domain-containing protein [Ferruginibacter sp.]|nr:DUF4174 domain-containing protein [Cytophagales bacterium]
MNSRSFFLRVLATTGWLALSLGAAAQKPGKMTLSETLKASRWEERVLLLCASTSRQADFVKQKELLLKEENSLRERDTRTIDVLYDRLSPADQSFLRDELGISAADFTVVLIGKDGGVKLRQPTPLTTQLLFSTIDAMPMRQREMRKNK